MPVRMKFVDYKLKTERLDAARPEDIKRAAEILRRSGLVAFPTETVYGLGASALDPVAVEKIFAAKQRPHWDPLIVHISGRDMLKSVALIPNEHIQETVILSEGTGEPAPWSRDRGEDDPSTSVRIIRTVTPSPGISNAGTDMQAVITTFWPGPLTLLLPKAAAIPDAVTAGRPLVGVRMPSHPVALDLIRRSGIPIAAPSANRFGHTSPTSAAHVLADLDGRIDAVLDGGPTDVGLESTVLDPTQWPMLIYRQGAVTQEQIEQLLGEGSVAIFTPARSDAKPESLPSPGVGLRHYAPDARLILVPVEPDVSDPRDILVAAIRDASTAEAVGVLLPSGWKPDRATHSFAWAEWDNPEALAHSLFAGLRALDDLGATVIVAPIPSGRGICAAIRDRLQKAAKP